MSAHSQLWIFHKLKIIQKSLLNYFSHWLMSPIWLVFLLKVCFQNLKKSLVLLPFTVAQFTLSETSPRRSRCPEGSLKTHWPLLEGRWFGNSTLPLKCYINLHHSWCTYWVVPRLTETTNSFVFCWLFFTRLLLIITRPPSSLLLLWK